MFEYKLTCKQKCELSLMVLFVGILFGGVLTYVPKVKTFWLPALVLDVYRYRLIVRNLRLGGAQPSFGKKFTLCNYMLAGCACPCAVGVSTKVPVKCWVDEQIELGKPFFDVSLSQKDTESDVEMQAHPTQAQAPHAIIPSGLPAVDEQGWSVEEKRRKPSFVSTNI